MKGTASRAMLERIPKYITYLEKQKAAQVLSVSSTRMAADLGLGDVQVRKELSLISGAGRPRIGYMTDELLTAMHRYIGSDDPKEAVIVGAGKLGLALIDYEGFDDVGVHIGAAFDLRVAGKLRNGKDVFLIDKFPSYCKEHDVKLGIITVPKGSAQHVCDLMIRVGIKAIWNFSPVTLDVPDGTSVINEKLAISLSQLRQQV